GAARVRGPAIVRATSTTSLTGEIAKRQRSRSAKESSSATIFEMDLQVSRATRRISDQSRTFVWVHSRAATRTSLLRVYLIRAFSGRIARSAVRRRVSPRRSETRSREAVQAEPEHGPCSVDGARAGRRHHVGPPRRSPARPHPPGRAPADGARLPRRYPRPPARG